MQQFAPGDTIEHVHFPPGMFPMKVLETRACEVDAARPGAHLAYRVIDPSGAEDWLCAHDVVPAEVPAT